MDREESRRFPLNCDHPGAVYLEHNYYRPGMLRRLCSYGETLAYVHNGEDWVVGFIVASNTLICHHGYRIYFHKDYLSKTTLNQLKFLIATRAIKAPAMDSHPSNAP